MPTTLRIKKSSIKKTGASASKVLSNSKVFSNINKQYLDFDYDIDEEFKNALPSVCDNKIDYEKISNLPKFKNNKLKNKISLEDLEDESDDLETEQNQNNNLPEDIDELDKHMIGNILYYIDYNKGIIYNTDYNIIGMIDDNGDIDIDSSL